MINARNLSRLGVAFLALLSAGCAAQEGFDVTVTNRLSDPITVWMTKAKPVAGDKYEEGWMPPEVLAVGTTQRLGGVAVDPGSTAHAVVRGTIASDDVAILRVYRAEDLNTILAIGRGNPDRLDVPLNPGTTDIDIIKQDGHLADVPHAAATP